MIAFARGFPNGNPGGDKPRQGRRTALVQPLGLDIGQWLALGGALLLGIGVFLPFLWFHAEQASPSLLRQELRFGMPVASVAILMLAGLSTVLAVRRSYVYLWLTGFTSYMVLAGAVLLAAHFISLATPLIQAIPPPAGPSEFFTFAAGWYVMTLGVLLLFGGALLDGILDQRRPTPPAFPTRRLEWRESEVPWVNRLAYGKPVGEG